MKNAIVTGATKGIGFSIVKTLLKEGYFVYVTYSADEEAALFAKKEFESISPYFSIKCVNQLYAEQIHNFAKELIDKPIDCIVCNAGNTVRKSTFDITDQDWNDVMQVNVNSHFFLIRDLWNQIQSDARIIFIGSLMAIHPHAMSLPYGVAKSALHALAKNLLKDFEGTNVTINTIAPGFVETEWQKNKPQEIKNNIYNKTALHRFATPDEIAEVVKFLLHNPFVNGDVIEVSGGYSYK